MLLITLLLITYIISFLIIAIYFYMSMKKGETLEDYIDRTDNLALFIISSQALCDISQASTCS